MAHTQPPRLAVRNDAHLDLARLWRGGSVSCCSFALLVRIHFTNWYCIIVQMHSVSCCCVNVAVVSESVCVATFPTILFRCIFFSPYFSYVMIVVTLCCECVFYLSFASWLFYDVFFSAASSETMQHRRSKTHEEKKRKRTNRTKKKKRVHNLILIKLIWDDGQHQKRWSLYLFEHYILSLSLCLSFDA